MSTWEATDAELTAMRAEYAKGATDNQWLLFLNECKTRNLRPGVHLVFQLRKTKEYDATVGAQVWVSKGYWITTIAALRLIIERTGKYAGQSEPEYIYLDEAGEPSIVSKIPLPQKGSTQVPREPWAVRVGIKRRDFDEPIVGMARFEAVAGFVKTDNGAVLTHIWSKRPDFMTAKCAEADGIRKAAPEEAGSYYIAEELKNEIEEVPATPPSAVVSPPPQPVTPPPVDQKPAAGTDSPRPGEMSQEDKTAIRKAFQPLVEKTKTEYQVEKLPATLPEHSGETLVVKADPKLAAALAAVPDLKPASELPPPKKRGRKPKPDSPITGRDVSAEGGITQADIDNVSKPQPAPEITPEAAKAEAEKFVAGLDPTPTKEEMALFASRTRALSTQGAKLPDLKNYILADAKKSDTKELTVGNWKWALDKLEQAQKDGTLVEATKNAPLPTF